MSDNFDNIFTLGTFTVDYPKVNNSNVNSNNIITENGNFPIPSGKTGWNSFSVNVPQSSGTTVDNADVAPNNNNTIIINGEYPVPSGKTGWNSFSVYVPEPQLQNDLVYNINGGITQTVVATPDHGYDGFSQLTINVTAPPVSQITFNKIKLIDPYNTFVTKSSFTILTNSQSTTVNARSFYDDYNNEYLYDLTFYYYYYANDNLLIYKCKFSDSSSTNTEKSMTVTNNTGYTIYIYKVVKEYDGTGNDGPDNLYKNDTYILPTFISEKEAGYGISGSVILDHNNYAKGFNINYIDWE